MEKNTTDIQYNPKYTDEMEMLKKNQEGGFNYQERRHDPWKTNYQLYRDEVQYNRLIQRQTVNLPIMKQTIRTLLVDVDDMPVLYFENLDNNEQAEQFKNEYWKYIVEENKMDLQDIVDKRQVFLFGRSFDQWQVVDGKVKQTIIDPQDIYVSRYTDPYNIHSSRFLIHTHIFVPLSQLEKNKDYDQEELKQLKNWFQSEMGLIKAEDNQRSLEKKNEVLSDLGVTDVDKPILGETYVEITLNFVFRSEDEKEEEQIYLYVTAESRRLLMKKPLEKIIGVTSDNFWRTHYPYASWADDLEKRDFWSDSIGDIVRQPNQIVNSWFSQMVENRTLKNFGMNYFDSTLEGFTPQTFQPVPWGWYGIPVPQGGRIQDIIQRVDIPDLSNTLPDIQFILQMMEKATGATSNLQGVQTPQKVTLGEVQIMLQQAKNRVKGMSKFYTQAWKERGLLFLKLIEASSDKLDAVKIYKQGRNTRQIYGRLVAPNDWKTKSGYRCKVWSQDEKDTSDQNALQKLTAVKQTFINNNKVNEIFNRKMLEFAGLTPEEITAIMDEETAKAKAIEEAMNNPANMGTSVQPPPEQNKLMTPEGFPTPQEQSQVIQ